MWAALWLVAAAGQQCSPVVKVERRDPLDPGNGYAWPDMYAGTWLQPTNASCVEPRKIGNIEGPARARVWRSHGLLTPALTRTSILQWSTSYSPK